MGSEEARRQEECTNRTSNASRAHAQEFVNPLHNVQQRATCDAMLLSVPSPFTAFIVHAEQCIIRGPRVSAMFLGRESRRENIPLKNRL